MVSLQLSNKEWYFLYVQIEKLIRENPENYIIKDILEKLVLNKPSIKDIKTDFQKEYDCVWIGGKDKTEQKLT